MTQYLLAVDREYAVPIPLEQTQQGWAGINTLGEKLTDAGSFVFRSGLLPTESATAARLTRGEAS